MNYGRFNWLPVWDKKFADFLMPIAPFASLGLVLIAFAILYAAFAWNKNPELKVLLLAFLLTP